jgi:hypothetical protein
VVKLNEVHSSISEEQLILVLKKGLREEFKSVTRAFRSVQELTFDKACNILRDAYETMEFEKKQSTFNTESVNFVKYKGNQPNKTASSK